MAEKKTDTSAYNPKQVEKKWYKQWEEKGFFHAQPDPKKKPYCIVIPPPNITGILHMGHALNNTIQDVLIRYKRMQGYSAVWMPGTDHAGIATQNVVEKKLGKEGKKRDDLGREKFLKEVWKWKEEHGTTIINQLKALGCSCDWQRTRFTMDEEYSKSVRDVFVHLHKKGLIYQGDYIINWCPRCQTALSDEEAPYHETQGNLYYIKYPLKKEKSQIPNPKSQTNSKFKIQNSKQKDYLVVATTRPETMLGDTAVAVNPKDKRYKDIIGETVILPLMEREIKVIADGLVDPEFGTGAVKVTPAHDPNDFAMGQKHRLEFILVMSPDGAMNKNAGGYAGMDRFKAREAILEDLKERRLLLKIEPHRHSVGHCYRCHTVIEPYMSRQWFVKMKPLAKPAVKAVKDGDIKFYPARWTKVYLNWMENIRDWCISRQIWWGHRIPVFYCRNCRKTGMQIPNPKSQSPNKSQIPNSKREPGIIVSKTKPEKCPSCSSDEIYQDKDVLDTWFSSWLWPFATFGWPFDTKDEGRRTRDERDLDYFYPTNVLVTAQEIIFFWVARMIMAGFEFTGKEPFGKVYIHGTVRDDTGKKMSKSLGNTIDPIEIIEHFGADALRFSIICLTAAGQDVYLSKEKFHIGRNFANKLWNASRFVISNLKDSIDYDLSKVYKNENLSLADRWILSCFYTTLENVNKHLETFRFNDAANAIYEFFWHKYCDWYVEIAKQELQAERSKDVRFILYKMLEKTLRILHPIMPFITEEVWSLLPRKADSIMVSPWPHVQKQIIDKKAEEDFGLIIQIITAIRNIRSEMSVPLTANVKIAVSASSPKTAKIIKENASYISRLAKAEDIAFAEKLKRPKHSAAAVIGGSEIFVLLEGIIDIEAEKARLGKKIEELESYLKGVEAKLKNKQFVSNAPKEVVKRQKEKKRQAAEDLKKLKDNLKALE